MKVDGLRLRDWFGIIQEVEPVRHSRQRSTVDDERGRFCNALPGAAPSPLLGSLNEAGLERILLHVP